MNRTLKIIFCLFLLIWLCPNDISAQFFDDDDYDIDVIDEPFIKEQELDTINLSLIDSIIAYSRMFIGTPYRYGGMTASGFDCSGFVSFVFRNFGIKLQRTASAQYASSTHIDRNDLKKGDLVFFGGRRNTGRIGHVGIVVSDSLENGVFRFIHASVTRGITISKSTEDYYQSRYLSASRVFVVQNDYYSKINTTQPEQPQSKTTIKSKLTTYTVKQGDTLYSIAKKFGISVDKLKNDNHLTNNNLKIKQKLVIGK